MYLHDRFRKQAKAVPISRLSSGNEAYLGYREIPYIVAEDNINDPNYYISQYDGAISYSDDQIGRLIDGLKELGLYEDTLIILTADHGELLGEHNFYFHHTGCYEENIRVPLMIRCPRLFPKGRVVSRQVNLIDIAATVLDSIGLDRPSYIQGRSLLAFVKPFRFYRVKYVFSFCGPVFSLRTENWKLIYDPAIPIKWELYNLKTDPKELHNLVFSKRNKFEFLKQKLDKYKHINFQKPILDEDKKTILRSLGYIQ